MNKVLINGVSKAGGIIVGTGVRITVGGVPVVLVGDSVVPHGDSPHSSANMDEGTPRVVHAGILVCFETHLADCGHPGTLGSARINLA